MRNRNEENVRQKAKIVVALLFAILFLPIIAPIVLLILLYRAALYLLIWLTWVPRGRNVLFVYSDSPIWRDYMVNEVLPLVRDRAVVLNWSERKKWSKWSLAVRAHRTFGGEYEFNPLVLYFRPFRLVKKFRFWSAFKDSKHGNLYTVYALRDELQQVVRD